MPKGSFAFGPKPMAFGAPDEMHSLREIHPYTHMNPERPFPTPEKDDRYFEFPTDSLPPDRKQVPESQDPNPHMDWGPFAGKVDTDG